MFRLTLSHLKAHAINYKPTTRRCDWIVINEDLCLMAIY